jgi:hypothetical protein
VKAIIIKDESPDEALKLFPADLIFQINNPLPPTQARVVTIPTDNVRAAAGAIAKHMTQYNITEFSYLDPDLQPYIDMTRKIILINHNQGVNYKIFFDNFFDNLPLILKSPGVYKDQFKGMPALIVSSGPSLNKNIHLFGEAKKKCLTITSGSAIGPVQKRGFEPDVACLIDPFATAADSFTPGDYRMACNYTALPKGVRMGKNVSFFNAGEAFEAPLPLPPTEWVQVDLSVASTAYNLAVLWGCEPIIFIGQDCGITEGQEYADGVDAKQRDSEDVTYAMLAEYFRIKFAEHPGTIYNCTEGGRRLGDKAKHLPLAEVLSLLPDRPAIEWEEGKPWDISRDAKRQAKEVRDAYNYAKMFDPKANTCEKIERFICQQKGTTAWNWLNKMILPMMYECGDDYRKWYLTYLKWQEWCRVLAERLENV